MSRTVNQAHPAHWTVLAGGSGLLLIVLGYVTKEHYLQIAWHTTIPVPAVWWAMGDVAAMIGPALFFAAAGASLARPERPMTVLHYLGWYVVSLLVGIAVLLRFNPEFALDPVTYTDVFLPQYGPSLPYALAVCALLAWLSRRAPTSVVLAGALAVAVALALTGLPVAYLGLPLLAFAIGWRLRYPLAAIPLGLRSWTRPLAGIGRAALPIAALLLPVSAVADAVLLRRLSALDGPVQLVVAATEPLLLTALVVAAGRTVHEAVRRLPSRRLAALVLAPALFLAAGCTADPVAATAGPATEVTISFGGDVHFEGRVARLLAAPDQVFGPAASLLSTSDLTLVNLETPITGRGEPEPKRYLFRAAHPAAQALRLAGVDAVSLANNHSMDYGREGLADTITAAKNAGVGVFGAGKDVDEAYHPWRTTVRGVQIAVFGFSQVDDLAARWAAGPNLPGIAMAFDVERAVQAVSAARADSDLVIVMPHWGTEEARCPTERQQDFARRMSDAGADLIVGSHAHVLQGAGRLGDTYVAYGLGNLLWYSSGLAPPFSSRSGILTLTVRKRSVIRSHFDPVVVSDTGQPRPLTGWQAALARRNYAQLITCAHLAPTDSD